MNKERDTIFLISLVAIGIIIISTLASYLHLIIIAPLIVLGIFFTLLILFTVRGNFHHSIENLEKIFFIITFVCIIISFILLYKPS